MASQIQPFESSKLNQVNRASATSVLMKSVFITPAATDTARHCPTCGGARRSDWLESTSKLIFDGVDHFQVVFTLPDELSRLALGNRRAIYDLLLSSSWKALKKTMASEHSIDTAAVMVLHTWNQKLDAHAHVHAVVPGCGPACVAVGLHANSTLRRVEQHAPR